MRTRIATVISYKRRYRVLKAEEKVLRVQESSYQFFLLLSLFGIIFVVIT